MTPSEVIQKGEGSMKKETNQTTEPLRGERLFKTAVNQILLHPETWCQANWHSSCGTKHCLGGWLQVLAGKPMNAGSVISDAMETTGITSYEANHLFRANCTISEMYSFAENFNRDGFDRAGFDRAGKKLTPFEL